MDWIIYDIEVFVNFFYVLCRNISKGVTFSYEISPIKDERKELLEYLNNTNQLMIGFNNLKFDWPLLNHFEDLMKRYPRMNIDVLNNNLKNKANQLIKSSFVHPNNKILQLDLLKLNHYDNLARIISLKGIEFNMRMNNVQELPYEHTAILTENEMEVVRTYCINDIEATVNLCKLSYQNIQDRFSSSSVYNTNLLNYNDAKIGEFILNNKLIINLNKENLGQTYRDHIVINDIIFPYIIFNSNAFNNLLSYFKSKTIEGTKNVFTEIPLEDIEHLKPNINITKFKKIYLKKLNVLYKDFEFTYGTGGIHGAEKGIFVSNDDYVIMSCDVSSLYPNIAIRNRLYPQHLGETFCDIYESIYEERKKYPKSDSRNGLYKLALNGAYGKSNSTHSILYDPQFTMSITLNGQLLLSMLSEQLMEIKDCKLLMINTDGLELLIPRSEVDNYYYICKEWEKLTNLNLEYAIYDKLIIANCNNYIGIFNDKKIKKKGAYTTNPELHKNHSKLIVPKAVEAFYLYGTPVEDFIRNHDDIFDFFLRTKLNKDSSLIGIGNDEIIELPRLTRYLITNTGYTLIKLMSEDRRFNVEKDYLCTPCNYLNEQIKKDLFTNINYEFYITKANKLLIGEDIEDE